MVCLLAERPSVAERVAVALADLLELPTALTPRGHMYAALCCMELHEALVRAAGQGWVTGASSAAPSPTCTGELLGSAAAPAPGARRSRRPGTGGGPAAASVGSGANSRARCGRQRDAALAALARLRDKVAVRVGAALAAVSLFDSDLSRALRDSPHVRRSRDVRLLAASALEPYAAQQLMVGSEAACTRAAMAS
jgi:hypothetical protein